MFQNSKNNNSNLISIDDLIARAKRIGIDFGKGNPRERLRYLTKIGLLPHAQRKSFNGKPSVGAYPEYVVELLADIDKKIKEGRTIQDLKKEKEKRESTLYIDLTQPQAGLAKISEPYVPVPIGRVLQSERAAPETKIAKGEESKTERKKIFLLKTSSVFKIIILLSIFMTAIFVLASDQKLKDNFYSYISAKSSRVVAALPSLISFVFNKKLAQGPPPSFESSKEIFLPPASEPYLTINAPLDVKDRVSTPALKLITNEFAATLSSPNLTADRTYIFPDISGTICLTTGNCSGLQGEVVSDGGISNRLAKFVDTKKIGVSSIEDLYSGVAVTIDSQGQVGIGTNNPRYPLHVTGRIQATGDICTNLAGGRCLSTLPIGGAPPSSVETTVTVSGVGGSGTANYLPLWTAGTTLGNSIIYQSGSNIGIGTTSPAYTLDVYGTTSVMGFVMPTGAVAGYVLTSDASGVATWQPSSSTLPVGTDGQTLRHNGTSWVGNSFLYNTGSAIGIGTTSPSSVLTVAGDGYFAGPLTLATTTIPQLVINYDADNYLKFFTDSASSTILASKAMFLNSLTGQVGLGSDVSIFNATSASVWAKTFSSAANDATVRKSGELILRSSVPIFKFPLPAQTTSTVPVAVTREISTSTLNSALPSALPGTTRKFAFLLNFADDIAASASSTWTIDLTSGTDTTFYFAGQAMTSAQLKEGVAHMSSTFSPPEVNWTLKVNVPLGNTIRVFNVFLLVFDKVN